MIGRLITTMIICLLFITEPSDGNGTSAANARQTGMEPERTNSYVHHVPHGNGKHINRHARQEIERGEYRLICKHVC